MHRIGLSPPRTASTTWRSTDAQWYAGSFGSSGSAGVAVSTAFQKRGTRVRVAPAFWARTTDTSAFGPANAPGSRKPVLNGPAAPAFETTARARAKPRIAARRTDGPVYGWRRVRSRTDAAPRGPLAPRRPGSDARRRDRDEQEGDEQEPAGTGRRGRRGERAGRRRAGRLEDGVAWDCGSRVGAMPRDRSSARDSRDGRRTEGPGRGRGARARQRRQSSRPWLARRSGVPPHSRAMPPRRSARVPSRRVRPRCTGRSQHQTEPSAAERPAIAGDATTTAIPAEQVAAMSLRIDD